jgi:hypothetical protein
MANICAITGWEKCPCARDFVLWGIVKENIFHLHLTTVEDLKPGLRHCLNDFQPSSWKVSRITWGKIKIFEENGGKHTDNFELASIATM